MLIKSTFKDSLKTKRYSKNELQLNFLSVFHDIKKLLISTEKNASVSRAQGVCNLISILV